MTSFTRWVLGHRLVVVLAWVVIAVAAFASVGPAVDALSDEFELPGRESSDAANLIEQRYGNGGPRVSGPLVPVVQLPEGTTVDSPGVRDQIGEAFRAVGDAIPGSRSADFASTGDRVFVSEDGRTTYGVVYFPAAQVAFEPAGEAIDQARAAAAGVSVEGAPVLITGLDVLATGDDESAGPSVLAETLIGGLGALIVLAFVFGSTMAFVPLLMAAIAIPTTFLALWPLAEVTEVSVVVQFLISLIGLGVAIDYSLLIVMRWREEVAAGRDRDDAVVATMEHAGRAVIFSGLAVAIGLLSLVVLPVPFLRSIGYGGMLIPVISTLVAVTLLPVVLATVGPRLDRWGFRRRTSNAGGGWVPWGRFVVRRRWIVGAVALLILLLLFIPVFGFSTGTPRADALASSGEGRTAVDALTDSGIGPGVLAPYEVAVTGGDPAAVRDAAAGVAGVRGAIAPDDARWRVGDTAIVNVFPLEEDSASTVAGVRDAVGDLPGEPLVGGIVAGNVDFNDAVYGNFVWVVLVILAVTFILLARVFRSLLLPLKAVVFNILSIGAVWGFMVVFWQNGHGSGLLFDIEPTGALTVWVPLMVFAFLYGLSMDYEVFILSRMREEYDRDGSTDRAVVAGLARTGRLVTAGSLILFLAFVALSATPGTDIKVFATALAIGILLDATVVRSMLLPAFVAVLGRWNWWLPVWAARILRVEPSLPPPERRGDTPLGLDPAPVAPATPATATE
ncbi:MMPL family transporter [Miltoncostaea oceani]|uniref:MMPL family transporter n=1 Tax=Miltoncostaea oceani TaxID=2843216 RepID=UPI001C3CF948|nr:MMPL family transporter [Miltoncostaea oceani]